MKTILDIKIHVFDLKVFFVHKRSLRKTLNTKIHKKSIGIKNAQSQTEIWAVHLEHCRIRYMKAEIETSFQGGFIECDQKVCHSYAHSLWAALLTVCSFEPDLCVSQGPPLVVLPARRAFGRG